MTIEHPPRYTTPISVLNAIALACGCHVYEIEDRLESINNAAGRAPRQIHRKYIAEERLGVIRLWLGTPEAGGVIEQAERFVRLNQVR